MALGYALRGANFHVVEDELMSQDFLPLFAEYRVVFRENPFVAKSLCFLESCLSIDLRFLSDLPQIIKKKF